MLIGYMRVSTSEQSLDLQRDALRRSGCEGTYEDICSGRAAERPGQSSFWHEYKELKSVAKVCTSGVLQLEKTVEALFDKHSGAFSISLTDNLEEPLHKITELRALLVEWAKGSNRTDEEAATRLGINRSTLYLWSKDKRPAERMRRF